MFLKEEIKYLNVARGILISLVVIGHIQIPDFISRFIYLFHIAALFYISGYFSKIDISSFRACCLSCLKRVGRLYFYYLKYEILFLLFKNLFFKVGLYSNGVEYGGKIIQEDSVVDFVKNVGLIIIGMGREVMASAFWYFISLIFAIIFFSLIRYFSVKQRLLKSNYFELMTVFVLFLGGCACNYWDVYLPRLAPAMTLILPFYWGYLQATNKTNITFENIYVLIFSVLILVVLSRYGSISMNANSFPDPIFFFLSTFCGVYFTNGISKWIEKYMVRFSRYFRYIGKRSLAIMIFHILSFKMVFLMQYLCGESTFKNMSQLLGNPEGSLVWFILFLLAGLYLSIFLFFCTEKLFSIIGEVLNKVFRVTKRGDCL